ncbi:UDP-3-O-(3-hydroxymyristoyl)glucosamine N-acyltransferase [bacterium]|nr:UDP-3-O-(3-hydroxymyristoyl)glucosamine N-acyltransferase [candidate division CSSED10-310 bacterium]
MEARKLSELVQAIDGRMVGVTDDFVVSGLAALDRARPTDISFLTHPKYRHLVINTQAGAVLVSEKIVNDLPVRPMIVVSDAYLALARLMQMLYPPVLPPCGIHPTAIIADEAVLGTDVRIGAHVTIDAGVSIGDETALFPGVAVGRETRIGRNCIIYPNVSLYHRITIGDRVIIHAGSVVGSDGFGFAPDGSRYEKIPQIGSVTIGDDVEIGANCTIDRGSLGMTVIASGVKLDNLIHLAHNVCVGENTVIAAQTGVSGSSTIGCRNRIGGQVGVTGHVMVGDDVVLTAKAGIMKSIRSREMISGFPQMPHQQWRRTQAALRHADEMREDIRRLDTALEDMRKRLTALEEE